jgi:nucleoside-diphosphate-sugar epimerase
MKTSPLHVIAGAGQIGPMIAARLLARGLRVRLVRRGAFTDAPAGAETVRADVSDPAAAADAMRGASVVYHTANPRYHRWPKELVPLARGIVAGAAAAGARLVALDNLYMYPGGTMSEDTAVAPRSKKGFLRAQAADVMLQADKHGELPVAILRPADFIGPGATNSIFGDRFWTKLLAGKRIEYLGDLDQPHTYSYAPDVADALVTLGTTDRTDVFGQVWMAPSLPAESTRVWIDRFARAAAVEPRTQRLAPWLLHLFGLFIPEAGELPEMIYQWQAPFVVDDRRFRTTFGASPTPVATVVADSLAWARARYAVAETAAAAA